MYKVIFTFILLGLLVACNKNHKVFQEYQFESDNYKLYILPLYSDDLNPNNVNLFIKRSFLINSKNTLNSMKYEWIFLERDAPEKMKVRYKLALYKNNDIVLNTWLNENMNTLIFEDKLLAFNDSLLLKHKQSFNYLPEYVLCINNIIKARSIRNSLVEKGAIVTTLSKGNPGWQQFDGKYELKKLKGILKPIRNVGKIRKEINKDFSNNNYALLDYEFDDASDSLKVIIGCDSSYINFIPSEYNNITHFFKYSDITIKVIGLKKSIIDELSSSNKSTVSYIE